MLILSLPGHALHIKEMIRKREDVDQWFFIRMNSPYDLYRFVHHFALAIDFHFCFGPFLDPSNLPIEWIRSRQRTEIALRLRNGYTVIVIPNAPNAVLGQVIADF